MSELHKLRLTCALWEEDLGWIVFNNSSNVLNRIVIFCDDCLEQDPEGCERKALKMLGLL